MSGRARAVLGGALLTAVALLGSGCSAGSGGSSESAAKQAVARDAAGGSAPRAAAAAAPSTGSSAGASAVPAVEGRSLVYTAELRLEAKDVTGALERLHTVTTGAGGYVSSETVDGATGVEGAQEPPQGGSQLVVKVPSAAFDSTLERFGQLGKVLEQHREVQDVTDKVIDVQSRLKTQRASVDRVRALMNRATGIRDVVALEGELSSREADLESLERQQQELAAQTAFSTVTVDLFAVAPPAPAAKAPRGFGSAVGHALAGGWHALYAAVRGLLIGLAAAAPFVAVLLPVGWAVARLRRRRTPRGTQPETD